MLHSTNILTPLAVWIYVHRSMKCCVILMIFNRTQTWFRAAAIRWTTSGQQYMNWPRQLRHVSKSLFTTVYYQWKYFGSDNLCNFVIAFIRATISFSYYGQTLNSGKLAGSIHLNACLVSLVEVPAYTAILVTMSIVSGRTVTVCTAQTLTGVLLLASVPLVAGECAWGMWFFFSEKTMLKPC